MRAAQRPRTAATSRAMPRIVSPLTAHGRAPITRPPRSMVRNQRRNNCVGRWLATASHVHNNLRMAVDFHACSGAKLPATMRNGLRITVARWPCNAVHQIAQRVRENCDAGRPLCACDAQACPRPDTRLLHQPALEGLTRSAWMDSPRQVGRNKFWRLEAAAAAAAAALGGGGGGLFREEGRPLLGDTASRGPTTIAAPESQFRTCPSDHGIQLAVGPQPLRLRNHNSGLTHRIMVKRLATSPHDPLGITDSACKNQLVVVSVQYGPFNPYIPIRSTTIGKSRVAIDPIAMHTSWRSNSDITSVTRSTTIGKSRVAIDPIAMHTSWRSNSDITSVTSIGYPRMSASGESSTTMHRLLHTSGSQPISSPDDPKFEVEQIRCGLLVAIGWLGTDPSGREEDATSFELVATPRIDVAAGSNRGRGSLIVENTSTVAPAGFVGGNALLLVAAVKRNPGFTTGRGFNPAGGVPGGG
ncbi:chitinase-3-like protein 2-like [Dorcoceras hygrometricum]|uniref:Chitinase-3-like protein 2-like n=1 Tax=Dorcoceras hygrometricum TaxID=472368 RepID=A0A2Z7C7D2_9LAMI|nr:chitinase-3-like protein 2-like [Dorcoceras hygrometricum]